MDKNGLGNRKNKMNERGESNKSKSIILLLLVLLFTSSIINAEELSLHEYNGESYGLMLEEGADIVIQTLDITYDMQRPKKVIMTYEVIAVSAGTYNLILPYSEGKYKAKTFENGPDIILDGEALETKIIGLGEYDESEDRDKAKIENICLFFRMGIL